MSSCVGCFCFGIKPIKHIALDKSSLVKTCGLFGVLGAISMNKKQRGRYEPPEALKEVLFKALAGRRYRLDCGHCISFYKGNLANDLTFRNGWGGDVKVICAQCGY